MENLNKEYCCSQKKKKNILSFWKGFFFGGFIVPLSFMGLAFVFDLLGLFYSAFFIVLFNALVLFVLVAILISAIMDNIEYKNIKGDKDNGR